MKLSTFSDGAFAADLSLKVRFHYIKYDMEAKTSPSMPSFGGKEGFKDFLEMFFGNATPIIFKAE